MVDWLFGVEMGLGSLWAYLALKSREFTGLDSQKTWLGWSGQGSPAEVHCVLSLIRMVLCIATDDTHSLSRLSLKFGALLKSCRHLLENAKKSHMEVVGVRCALGTPPSLPTLNPCHSQELIILYETFPRASKQRKLLGLEFC